MECLLGACVRTVPCQLVHTKTKKEIRLVFTLPYHPHIKHLALKRALQKHWSLINLAYKRQRNIIQNSALWTVQTRENVRILMELLDEQNGV